MVEAPVRLRRRRKRHSQSFGPPQTRDLLVVDLPALGAGVVVGAAKSLPWMGFRPLA
jgi:hypothetical protein